MQIVGQTLSAEHVERRKFHRYSYQLGVEVRHEEIQTVSWGSIDDLSEGGCYVNTFSPLPVGTRIVLMFKPDEVEIVASGRVATFHPGVGMGIEFTNFLNGENRLKSLLSALDVHSERVA